MEVMFSNFLKILFFLLNLLVNNRLLTANSIFLKGVQTLFNDKNCVEASLVPILLDHKESLILESSDSIQGQIVNDTKIFDKSSTAKIHELAQYNNIEFVYKLISEEGPPHSKIFKIELILGDEIFEGSGPSLKKAKQAAATLALQNTQYERPSDKIKIEEEKSQTPTVILNNISAKLGISVSYLLLNGDEEKTIDSYGSDDESYGKSKSLYSKINSTGNFRVPVEDSQISGPFTVTVRVGERAYKGTGHSIQAARHDAALKALQGMEQQILFGDGVCTEEESTEQCKRKKERLKSPISRIHELAQKHGLLLEFKIISESGKSHKKMFVTQCILADLITEGEGTSKKESKRISAEKMLEYFPKESENLDEKFIVNGLTSKKKKRKNQKKKMIKDAYDSFMHGVSNMASLWSTTSDNSAGSEKPKSDRGNGKGSPKSKILGLGNALNIQIEFTDLGQDGGGFLSLLKLGVNPPHLCLGKAVTRKNSHEVAALFGLKYLQKSGIFEKENFAQKDLSDDIEEFEDDFEDDFNYASFHYLKND